MNTESISKPMNQLSERYQEMQGRAVESAKSMYNATDHFVHENPWWTVALVAVSGMLIGMLISQAARSD